MADQLVVFCMNLGKLQPREAAHRSNVNNRNLNCPVSILFFPFVSTFNVRFDWLAQMLVANQPPPAMEEGINSRWLLI